jgi:DNA replication licensing factor MCM3
VILESDLVDIAKPGDRINIVGVYKCFASVSSSESGIFRPLLLALTVNKSAQDI